MTGGPVRMKERRDPKTKGVEEWMHAVGTKAVYDEAADKITLTGNAKISRSENGTVKDTTVGDIIIYDMRRARSYVKGDTVGGHKTRVNTGQGAEHEILSCPPAGRLAHQQRQAEQVAPWPRTPSTRSRLRN